MSNDGSPSRAGRPTGIESTARRLAAVGWAQPRRTALHCELPASPHRGRSTVSPQTPRTLSWKLTPPESSRKDPRLIMRSDRRGLPSTRDIGRSSPRSTRNGRRGPRPPPGAATDPPGALGTGGAVATAPAASTAAARRATAPRGGLVWPGDAHRHCAPRHVGVPARAFQGCCRGKLNAHNKQRLRDRCAGLGPNAGMPPSPRHETPPRPRSVPLRTPPRRLPALGRRHGKTRKMESRGLRRSLERAIMPDKPTTAPLTTLMEDVLDRCHEPSRVEPRDLRRPISISGC